MDEKERMSRELIQRMEQLPPEAQQAIYLLIKNMDVIEQIPWEPMTLEEKDQLFAEAIQRKDYLSAAILAYKWMEAEGRKG